MFLRVHGYEGVGDGVTVEVTFPKTKKRNLMRIFWMRMDQKKKNEGKYLNISFRPRILASALHLTAKPFGHN